MTEQDILPEDEEDEQAYNQPMVEAKADDDGAVEATEDSYETQAMLNPERQVDLPDDAGIAGRGTLDENMQDLSDLTDQQAFLLQLFPNIGTPQQKAVMVGRVSPDVFLPLLRIGVTNDIMMSDPDEEVDVNSIIAKHYTLLSIGLDGKGRIDIAELSGAAREEKQLEAGMGGAV